MIMHGALALFAALSLGYVLCVLAKKQTGILKSVGYTIGISILTLTFLYGLLSSEASCYMRGKMCMMKGAMSKHCRMGSEKK